MYTLEGTLVFPERKSALAEAFEETPKRQVAPAAQKASPVKYGVKLPSVPASEPAVPEGVLTFLLHSIINFL